VLLCTHVIAFICSIRGACLEDYVHEYYSLNRFRVAYEGMIAPMPDKSQWVTFDPGFQVHPPNMKRPPDKPKKAKDPWLSRVDIQETKM
jgi:hypothetical protein